MAALESDPDAYLEVDHEFHMEICRAADNRILDRIMYSARWLGIASRRVTNEDSLPNATATTRSSTARSSPATRTPPGRRCAPTCWATPRCSPGRVTLSGVQFFTAPSGGELRHVYAELGEQIGYEVRRVDTSRPWIAGIARGRRLPHATIPQQYHPMPNRCWTSISCRS